VEHQAGERRRTTRSLRPPLERREWRSGRRERGIYALGIFQTRFDENVEMLGSARVPVERDSMAAQHDKHQHCGVLRDVAKIVEEFDYCRDRRTNCTGRLSTDWRALAIPARLKLSMVRRVVSEIAASPLVGVKSSSGSSSRALCMTITFARSVARWRRAICSPRPWGRSNLRSKIPR
jgi:hypothetical protein